MNLGDRTIIFWSTTHKRVTTLSHPSVAIVIGRTTSREVEVTRYDAMMVTLTSGIIAFIDAIPTEGRRFRST